MLARSNSSFRKKVNTTIDEVEVQKKVPLKIILLRFGVFFLLASLAGGLGAASYIVLRNIELATFQDQFDSSVHQITISIENGLKSKFLAAAMVGHIFAYAINNTYVGNFPNVTLPGFEDIMNDLNELATTRAISFNPLVTNLTRKGWEAYARENAHLLNGPPQLYNSPTWNISMGIYNRTVSGKFAKDSGWIPHSPYPTMMFPVWQIAPLASNYKTIMFNAHSAVGSRQKVIDKGIALKQGGLTDFIQLIQDGTKVRPSTILYAPLLGLGSDKPIIGYFGGVFSWDTMLQSALPSYIKQIDCVIKTSSKSFTLGLGNGKVVVRGTGDLHDSKFDSYGRSVTEDLSYLSENNVAQYSFTLYPTDELYNNYITTIPRNVCIIVVFIIFGVVLVLALYDWLIKSREKSLISAAEQATNTSNMVRALLPSFLSKSQAGVSGALGTFLEDLPVHKAILEDADPDIIVKLIEENRESAREGIQGKTAFDFALERDGTDPRVLHALLVNSLPYDTETKEEVDPTVHNYAWMHAVQHDKFERIIVDILTQNPSLAVVLALAEDAEGRQVANIASPKCKKVILQFMHFYRRYEITTLRQPHHQSATCVVHLAFDHMDNNRAVALKFMRFREHFQREIYVRNRGGLDNKFVVGILRYHDPDDDEAFRQETTTKDFADTPYCIVMEMGDRNLYDMLSKENIAGRDWYTIRAIAGQICKCIAHMHNKGFIHGDLKPLNIIRIGANMRLIDLDASANYKDNEGEISGRKYSSGYVPPEMIYCNEAIATVRSPLCKTIYVNKWMSSTFYDANVEGLMQHADDVDAEENIELDFECVPAHPAHDLWSLGVVLYQLTARSALFNCDFEGNIANASDMRLLHEWSEKTKMTKLAAVHDKYARNLISQLLSKDPAKRPSIDHVLSHPFLTGKSATRLKGETAEFDVFISYREASDLPTARLLYELLTKADIKVWWDKRCLQPGEPWEEGFIKGLVKSSMFVPIMSRNALNHPIVVRQSFAALTTDSPIDNVFLEHRLALELRERGLVEKIFPVFVGDIVNGICEKYSFSGPNACYPTCQYQSVNSVDEALAKGLDGQGLGLPYQESQTVAEVLSSIVKFQGGFVLGPYEDSVNHLAGELIDLAKAVRNRVATRRNSEVTGGGGSRSSQVQSRVSSHNDLLGLSRGRGSSVANSAAAQGERRASAASSLDGGRRPSSLDSVEISTKIDVFNALNVPHDEEFPYKTPTEALHADSPSDSDHFDEARL